MLLLLCVLTTINVVPDFGSQRLDDIGEDVFIYRITFHFQNVTAESVEVLERWAKVITPEDSIIEKSIGPYDTPGEIPPHGEYEWTDTPWIFYRWRDKAMEMGADRLILRMAFSFRGKQTGHLYVDSVDLPYIIDTSLAYGFGFYDTIVQVMHWEEKPLLFKLVDIHGLPVFNFMGELRVADPGVAKPLGFKILGVRPGTTIAMWDVNDTTYEIKIEVSPAVEDTAILPPVIYLVVGETREFFVRLTDSFMIYIEDTNIASLTDSVTTPELPYPIDVNGWSPVEAWKRCIEAVRFKLTGKRLGTTYLHFCDFTSGVDKKARIEVIPYADKPVARWRNVLVIFKSSRVRLDDTIWEQEYSQKQIDQIIEAAHRFAAFASYLSAGALVIENVPLIITDYVITEKNLQSAGKYGLALNPSTVHEVWMEHFKHEIGEPLSSFDGVMIMANVPRAGAAFGGYEWHIDSIDLVGLYIPNFWAYRPFGFSERTFGPNTEVMLHEWIHDLEIIARRSGVPISSADGALMEFEHIRPPKDPTYRRPRDEPTWMGYYMHVLRDQLTIDKWRRLQTRTKP